ncbi:MAG: hypothetical protein ACO1OB_16330 [Archangium sp.]
MTNHPGELALRRFVAEEIDVTEHLRECVACAAKVEALREEQRAFEKEIPFDRFAAGVERAARHRPTQSRRWVGIAMAAAAVMIAVVLIPRESTNRVKGGATAEFVVAGATGQRNAEEPEQLKSGERIRIGVSGAKYALVVSIDERGEVSPVYDEVVSGHVWLPESIEFTGSGRELVLVVLSDERQSTSAVSIELRKRFDDVKGDLSRIGVIDVPGSQVHRTFIKP